MRPLPTLLLALSLLTSSPTHAAPPKLRIDPDPAHAAIPFLSWDTEGGPRADTNLLRKSAHIGLRVKLAGRWLNCSELPARVEHPNAVTTTYHIPLPDTHAELHWTLHPTSSSLSIDISTTGDPSPIQSLDLHVPFDPATTPTTLLPHDFAPDGSMLLPALISSPDFGQMLLTDKNHTVTSTRLLGDRAGHWTTLVIEFSPPKPDHPAVASLQLTPFLLPPPQGLKDTAIWPKIRRGWFNALQPSSQWGDQSRPFSAPPGILANNVISDPASCSLWFYADQAFFTPRFTPDISPMTLVRRSVEWWLDHRTRPTGEIVGYWDYTHFLDADAGPIIAAWDYVESTSDLTWLTHPLPQPNDADPGLPLRGINRIEQLEHTADFLASRDIDKDGLIEATQPGTPNSLQQPNRSDAWWDALNCGHKDAYTNAIIYRAFRCLADLESKLHRPAQQQRYTHLADALQSAYYPTLLNPATGLLAWWKDRDNHFHDFYSPTVNGLAIEYGLVPPDSAKQILTRLHAKLNEVHFTRPDLGVPPQLIPVPRADYLQPNAPGLGAKPDGSDAFQQYMNGGITPGQTLHFLAAHYRLQDLASANAPPNPNALSLQAQGFESPGSQADTILTAMLTRQSKHLFQNGVRDTPSQGIDWTTWTGQPCGYEGYLADSFRFLQAALLREKPFRDRLYRPLNKIQD